MIAAEAAGAQLAAGPGTGGLWMPVSAMVGRDGQAALFPHIILDRAKPGLLAVNHTGRRFTNEADSYHAFVEAMLAAGCTPERPAYLVCDRAFIRAYGLGFIPSGTRRVGRFVRSGYLIEAPDAAGLAARIGVDAAALAETLAAYNRDAVTGTDEAFGRGGSDLNRFNGDPACQPNPCMRPVAAGPLYAVAVWPADLASSRACASMRTPVCWAPRASRCRASMPAATMRRRSSKAPTRTRHDAGPGARVRLARRPACGWPGGRRRLTELPSGNTRLGGARQSGTFYLHGRSLPQLRLRRELEPRPPRIAFVTIGQAPRDDVVPELVMLTGQWPQDVAVEQFGALDGLTAAQLAATPLNPNESRLYTRLADGTHVTVGGGLIGRRLDPLLHRLDGEGFDLIVLITTGLFQPVHVRTPFLHGQLVVDAWIGSLVMGACKLGLIYPLPDQHRGFAHGTLIQNAQAVAATGRTKRLEDATAGLADADLILMHSVGYTEAMAQSVSAASRKPVVTARRIIAGSVRLHLAHARGLQRLAPGRSHESALEALLDGAPSLTRREREVLSAAMQGGSNKEIGRKLGISHRTVEIHRGRGLGKLGAGSAAELIRRALIMSGD